MPFLLDLVIGLLAFIGLMWTLVFIFAAVTVTHEGVTARRQRRHYERLAGDARTDAQHP